jgi:hypothetical protein
MAIQTYFSHSYRLEDQNLNQKFWSLFSEKDFSFFVDPPSDATIHAHLERMMGRCQAFVAVVNHRRGMPRFFCSRFVLYEFGLSIQARRPRLLLIDRRVSRDPFQSLDADETHIFSVDQPLARQDELVAKIERLRRAAEAFSSRRDHGRGKIAVMVPPDRSRCAYAKPKTLALIRKAADLASFGVEECEIPYEHNAFFALALDRYEAVILDVCKRDLPDWVFAYVYGRLIPSIKLVRVLPGEIPTEVPLPPLVKGLRMDEREPGVESVIYWRDTSDLIWQLERAFHKLDEEQTVFHEGREGVLYFKSIGRRPARIFISNANDANPLARMLSEELRLRNIQQFQYKDPTAIPSGSNWPDKIRSEVQACDMFIALIGPGYRDSEWCREELRIAQARTGIDVLPYLVEKTDVKFLGEKQVAPLPADQNKALDRVLEDIEERLTRDERRSNHRMRQTTLLGGSRESVIDAIRHVSRRDWPKLLSLMRDHGVTVQEGRNSEPVRPRHAAEQLFAAVQRADCEPTGKKDLTGVLVEELAVSPPENASRRCGTLRSGSRRVWLLIAAEGDCCSSISCGRLVAGAMQRIARR